MNKLILTVIVSLFSLVIYAQDKVKEQSNAEKFSERGGTLIQKEFEDVNSIKRCKIQVARFQDMIGGQKTKGIRFEYIHASSYSSDTKLALLDEDEIDGLIKSLKIINDKILVTTPSNYTEVSFKSRSGFEAGCFNSKGKWSFYIKLERFDSNSFVFMDKEDLNEFLSIIEQAKAKL